MQQDIYVTPIQDMVQIENILGQVKLEDKVNKETEAELRKRNAIKTVIDLPNK
jgi:hypothetical protein